MNVSSRWLFDLMPGLESTTEEICDQLARRGAPVEALTITGDVLGDVVVGKVITAERHPNADRLTRCVVDAGGGSVPVVCGAPNVEAGSCYAFAPVGSVLPGDLKIRKAKIRGEVSLGMLCSKRELGLGTDDSGILELEPDCVPGQSVAEILGLQQDTTLDVEVTPNRGDLLSHVGVVRELLSEGDGEILLPPIPGDPGVQLEYLKGDREVQSRGVTVRIQDPDLCSRYLAGIIRGVKIGPSPHWLQERLRGAGSRSINNVVDATNYAMLELGQPLHAFDLGGLEGSTIIVRRAGVGEKSLTTLDDVERCLTDDMLLICDSESPVGLAGIMGGQNSEVDDDTTDILLECALFDPKQTRATRKALGMSTDASYRFERGVDPEGMERVIERCISLILAIAGGEVDGPVLDCQAVNIDPQVISLRLSRIERLLGVAFESDAVRQLLQPLGFKFLGEGEGRLQVRIPGYRSYDVTREVDLVEEVARAYGYDEFPADLSPYEPSVIPDDPMFQLQDDLRSELIARGLFEAQTPGFAPEGEGDVEVSNPLVKTERYMRNTLVPALVRRVEYNLAHGNRDVRLFEIGTSFQRAGIGEAPHEEIRIAAVLSGRRAPPHWSHADELFEIWDIKCLLEVLANRVHAGAVVVTGGAENPNFDSACVLSLVNSDKEVIGVAGRVADGLVDTPASAGDIWALEIKIPSDIVSVEPIVSTPLSNYPSIEWDLALVVPPDVSADSVSRLIYEEAGELLEYLDIFDVAFGRQGAWVPREMAGEIGLQERSLGFRLRFRALERTLRDKEVDKVVESVLKRLEEELGVEARR